MSNYAKTTDFAIKDGLAPGNPSKVVKGTEIDTEFNNIATAVSSKADTNSPNFTGTANFATVNSSGTITAVTFSGALAGNATSATNATNASFATNANFATNCTYAQSTVAFHSATWQIYESGGYLYFVCNGVGKMRFGPDGTMYSAGDAGGYVAI